MTLEQTRSAPAAIILAFALSVGAIAALAEERPNIILILADDMGYDIAALGHPHVKTPHLDRLVAEGRVVENFYAGSPVCSPTRASFMTGYMPTRVGIHDYLSTDVILNQRRGMVDFLDSELTTVADVARRAGYRTGHFGKDHIARGKESPPIAEYGFEQSRVFWGSSGQWFKAYSSDYVVREAIDFVDKVGDDPFYLNIWLYQMHTPVFAYDDQKVLYEGEVFPPADFESYMSAYAAGASDPHERFLLYNTAVSALDAAVGRFLAHLKSRGLDENTLIVFTSDNGPEDYRLGVGANPGMGSSGRYRGRKRSLYEGGIRMPFIARWPGRIPAGSVDVSSVITSSDWLPTVASLLGEASPGGLDGEDRSRVLLGEPAARSKPIIWEFRNRVWGAEFDAPRYAVRDGDWKLLWQEEPGRMELYNLITDPEERTNLVWFELERAAAMKALIKNFETELTPTGPVLLEEPVSPGNQPRGGSIVLEAAASSSPPPRYQWYLGVNPLADDSRVKGAGTPVLKIDPLTPEDAGSYRCVVSNEVGEVATRLANLVVDYVPEILTQPKRLLAAQGVEVSLSVGAVGTSPLSFQWMLNGEPLGDGLGVEGSQTPSLRLSNFVAPVTIADAAGFSCVVSNLVGSVESDRVGLRVDVPGAFRYEDWALYHLGSTTGQAASGADFDGDSASNFLEFGLVSSPTESRDEPALQARSAANQIELSYRRWKGGSDGPGGRYTTELLAYEIEQYRVGTWGDPDIELELLRIEPDMNGLSETVIYRVVDAPPSVLLRLSVRQR